MKRLFPTISHGVIVLAAIRVPPVTAQANRHRPRPAHPGSPHAAPNATPIAATANRPAPAGGRIASPPSSTASAANATPRPRPRPEPPHPPPRRRIRHPRPLRRLPHPAPAAGHLPDDLPDHLRRIQALHQHERREQSMGHLAGPAPDPGHEDLPAAARLPDPPQVARPEHHRDGARRAVRTRELHLPACCRIRTGRKRARPYDGHGRHTASDPSSRPLPTKARRDLLTFKRDRCIMTRP